MCTTSINDAVFMKKGLSVKKLYHETDTSGRHLSAKGKEHLMKHMIETVKNIRQKRLQDHMEEDSVAWENTPPGVHNCASKEKKI